MKTGQHPKSDKSCRVDWVKQINILEH